MKSNTGSKLGFAFFLVLLLCVFSACSSVPRRPVEVVLVREAAAVQLERANRDADRGNYTAALSLAAEVRRAAISVDDPSLRVRTGLSMGNSLFFLGRRDEADAAWRSALADAEAEGDAELTAICRIYIARGEFLSAFAPVEGAGGADIAEIRLKVQTELGAVKADRFSAALGWVVIGLAEKEMNRYREAEDALKKALALHEEDRYLEQAAYDWYLIASVFSVAGQYTDAVAALKEALKFDRRAENVYGLGADWLAMGDVYSKAGSWGEAEAAYQRAEEIFRSGGFVAEAETARKRNDSGE
ncbi:MAG: tetratricopeptide repeat protein [Treponema sp.]|nr:tetratricopeptide repeat protein [Treponema sp.]